MQNRNARDARVHPALAEAIASRSCRVSVLMFPRFSMEVANESSTTLLGNQDDGRSGNPLENR